jgi:hypothetical protein
MLRVLGTQGLDIGAMEKRGGIAFAGVTEEPQPVTVGGRHRHLDGVLDSLRVPGCLDNANCAFDG